MAILRNPLFFTLLILLGGAVYVMYLLNLLKPAMAVGQRMLDEALDIAKQKLKEFVIDDPTQHGHNLNKISNKKPPTEEIELDDLNN
ncbi:Dynamin-like GTPase that mediates homotypic ER fusion [Cerrena zonata]|uniref:Dynamin-like GTPase that mediates homotypic ER fusion n=1 Tax=Cerrena zonata TaxID=2478898 RepID=A0AAW0FKV8_9APHY